MTSEKTQKTETVLKTDEIDSAKFEETVSSILCGLGAQKYIDIFKKQNIDQYGLSELSDEDLTRLGIVEPEIRTQIIERAKLIPAYDETTVCALLLRSKSFNMNIHWDNQVLSYIKNRKRDRSNLGPMEIVEVFEECALLLHRIHLSMVASNMVLTKTKRISDCLLHKDKYASNIALFTLNEMVTILNSMDNAVHTHLKMKTNTRRCTKKKIIVGTIGSAVIAMLAVLFSRSLKQLD